uniref:Cellulase SS, extracellular cellulase complex subunit SS, cellulosome subunit SS, CELS (Fragments) n=1 Tax=Acetivibrio thermocellus TaxID=1515 RepID=Q9R670_ACETH
MVKSRKISILLAVAMLVSIMIPTTAFAKLYGDVNDDGKVNSTDAVALKRYVLRSGISINTDNADLNEDGRVNSTDLGILKRYILKEIDTLPYKN